MIEFGIAPLDKEFGGIEKGTLLVEGTAGCGKAVLGYHLINSALGRGEPVIVVTSSRTPEDVKKDLTYYGMKAEPITWIATVGEVKGENMVQTSIGELYTISDAIRKQVEKNKGKKVTVVLDVVSSALMSNSIQQVYKFYSSVVHDLKKADVVGFFLMELEMHDPKDIAAMEHSSDMVLQFVVKTEENKGKKGFIIKKKGGRPVPERVFDFKLTEKGLEVTQ
ncbi:RAD55 family ATPase [archaeon]